MATPGYFVSRTDKIKQKRKRNEATESSCDSNSDDNDQKPRRTKLKDQGPTSAKRHKITKEGSKTATQGTRGTSKKASNEPRAGHSSDDKREKKQMAFTRGKLKSVKQKRQRTFVAIDLETTGLIQGSVMPHITQIAAVEKMSKKHFAVYTKPKVHITIEAQKINGIRMDENGGMLVNGSPTVCDPILTAIEKLCHWLKQFPNVVLVAHYGRKFDFPILMTAVQKTNMEDMFLKAVSSYVDSVEVFREKCPDQSLKQENLVRCLLGRTYNAHNAIDDADALRDLLDLCQVEDLRRFIFLTPM